MPHPCTTEAGIKLRGADKVASVPIPVARQLRKPEWIRAAFRGSRSVRELTDALRANRLHTVCEEANCPNLGECFARGTATFMIMGAICTRRCPSCDVGHGRPRPLDPAEPKKLADTVRQMQMGYVVITSVNRDDLRDGGARHFAECIREVRAANPGIVVEVLTPDFRGRVEPALELLATEPPDVFNHNIETVPSRYRELRPGADYRHSLDLLARFKARHPGVATKSGLMLGVGETREEIERIQNEESGIFEKGGTAAAAQTGEEYRQELRKALQTNVGQEIVALPWKAGSGMANGSRPGYFFCARVGERVFLRFVPEGAAQPKDVVEEMGTCLRLIECTEETERVDSDTSLERAYAAWNLAQESILLHWNFFTDSKNLQPKIRPLNLRVDEFLMEFPHSDVDQARLDRVSNILTSPWPRREENKLREVYKSEHASNQEKALALIAAVEETGIEPFEQPERFPRIEEDEVRLVCWMEIQAVASGE